MTVISLQQFVKMWYVTGFYYYLDSCTNQLSSEKGGGVIPLLPIHHQLLIRGYRSKTNNENYCPYASPLSAVVPAVTESLACPAAAEFMHHLMPDKALVLLPFQHSFSLMFPPQTIELWARYFKQNPHWGSKRVRLDCAFWPEIILFPLHCKGYVAEVWVIFLIRRTNHPISICLLVTCLLFTLLRMGSKSYFTFHLLSE